MFRKFFIILFCNLFLLSYLQAQEKNTVYIYHDEGVSEESLAQTLATMKTFVAPNYHIKTLDAKEVIAGQWQKNAALFIMPGGADLPYVKKLNGIGNFTIKNYVQQGGAYLGICAGAYYASATVEFDKNGDLEVLGKRELDFFSGKSIGPILAKYDYASNRGARAAKLLLSLGNIKASTVYYNGGGYFADLGSSPHIQVLGYYENQQPSILLIHYGKGKVILSGVHIEYDPALLSSADPDLAVIIPELQKYNTSRKILVTELLRLLALEVALRQAS